MGLIALDHVNILTPNLERMTAWYCDVLGLVKGDRPQFRIPGAWLYIGDTPAVHLVDVADAPANEGPAIEHFAIRATGLSAFKARLDAHGVAYTVDPIPAIEMVQVNVRDCDGNHIHVDFPAAEA
ncbi:MAG: VOC family protein [Pseudomonadota bacterium]